MDSLLTNRLDPALLRVMEKRGNEHEAPPKRRRPTPPERVEEQEDRPDSTAHEIDDLA